MSPKGSANLSHNVTQTPELPIPALKVAEGATDLVYRFKISRRAAPIEFRNLWELAVKGPQDKDWRTEIDADALQTCIGHIGFIFEQDGL